MTTKDTIENVILSNLRDSVESFFEDVREANKNLSNARQKLEEVEIFVNNEMYIDDSCIEVTNSDAYGNGLTIMSRCYFFKNRPVLLTINEIGSSFYVGNIICSVENKPLYACQFSCDSSYSKQELFDRLLVHYIEWRFDL